MGMNGKDNGGEMGGKVPMGKKGKPAPKKAPKGKKGRGKAPY